MGSCRAGMRGVGAAALVCATLVWPQSVQAQIKLEYKYPEGKKLRYKLTSKTHQSWMLMGMEIETEEEETIVRSRTIGMRRPDSTLPVEEKVESLRTELALPGGLNVIYDSGEPNIKNDNPQLAFLNEIFKLRGELVYTVVLDARNKVKAVEGAEKLLAKVDGLSPAARDAERSQLDSAALKTMFEQEHNNLPDILARRGEPWERTEVKNIGNGITLTFHKKYEYLGAEKHGDKMLEKIGSKAIEVDLKQDAQTKSNLKVVKSNLRVESSQGTILFDHDEGCVVSTRDKTRIKGVMTLAAGPDKELPAEIDVTLGETKQLQIDAR